MQKDKIQEILDIQDPEENNYDIGVSLLIDAAARAGKDLSIDEASQKLMQEVKSESKSLTKKRLSSTQKTFESFPFLEIAKQGTVSLQMSLFGLIDPKASMKEYDAKSENISFLSEKRMLEIAQSSALSSKLPKGFVFISHDNETYSYGKLYYWEESKISKTWDLDKHYHTTLNNPLPKENLLNLAFHLHNLNQINHPYHNVLVRFASQSNNAEILHYLFPIAHKLNLVNIEVFINCLFMAIKNQCLSNVKALLEIQKASKLTFDKSDKVTIDFNLFSLLDNGKLNTAAPIIDIFMILYKNSVPLSGQSFSYASELTAIQEEKIINKRLVLREAVAFHLLSLLIKPGDSKQLLTAFYSSSMSEIPSFADKFCLQHSDIFKYVDTTVFNNSINPEMALRLDNLMFQKNQKEPSYLPKLTQQLSKIINSLFSGEGESPQLILQYLLPSLFDELSIMIENWTKYSASSIEFQDRKKALTNRLLASTIQDNISDCGYWSLFNAFKMLIELPTSPSGHFKYNLLDSEIPKLTNQFKQFKSWVNSVSMSQYADLTPTTLENVFNHAVTGKEAKLSELFPTLQKRLLRWRESTGIPAYTIINSHLDETLNLNTFGGCLPSLKLQIAINFYRLAQLKDERLLHCILIGVDGHWHVQLLATSYFSKGSLDFFRVDSAITPIKTLKLINRYLQELLKDSETYVGIVAEELISPIYGKLLNLGKTASISLGYGVREQEIQENCELLIKFFQAFYNLALAKKYLPALQLAKKIAHSLKEDCWEFKKLYSQLTDLCYLTSVCYLKTQPVLG